MCGRGWGHGHDYRGGARAGHPIDVDALRVAVGVCVVRVAPEAQEGAEGGEDHRGRGERWDLDGGLGASGNATMSG